MKDYLYILLLLSLWEFNAQDQFGHELIVSNGLTVANSVYAADLDHDGDMDVLIASELNDIIVWYANDGLGNFEPENIIENEVSNPIYVYAIDLDGDGDLDVLSASYGDNKIVWYENDGLGNFGDQNIIDAPDDIPISNHASDLDGDDDVDVIIGFYNDNKIVWYENDGLGNFEEEKIISNEVIGVKSITTSDLDDDGDLDLLIAAFFGNNITWYENDGLGNFVAENIIDSEADAISYIQSADLDDDGDLDVIMSKCLTGGDNRIVWYINYGEGNFGQETFIDQTQYGACSLFTSDIDGDGDLDLLSAIEYNSIAWHENDGQGTFSNHKIIASSIDNLEDIFVTDIDGDGDGDILCNSSQNSKVAWYENMPSAPTVMFELDICQFESTISIENLSIAYFLNSTIHWDFGDGNSSNEIHAIHEYQNSGIYEITLIMCNSFGCDSLSQAINILQFDFKPPSFVLVNEEITFNNSSNVFTNWTWLFGDGNQSLEQEPTHIYSQPGEYEITVILTNDQVQDCTFTETYNITVSENTAFNDAIESDLSIHPNPCLGNCAISWKGQNCHSCDIQIIDLRGNIVIERTVKTDSDYLLNSRSLSSGIYFLRIKEGDLMSTEKFVVQH